ncbi:MAG: DUF4352 domain-containing protein [Bryobacterales bacterium]|nr:DUF4352 domain-containing protein [Bryobacterales bacterium]
MNPEVVRFVLFPSLAALRRPGILALPFLLLLAASACVKQKAPVEVYAMGERAEAGSLVYNVLEAAWKTQLGEGPHLRVPGNRFLLLRLSITNGGPTEASVPAMTLVSSSGTEYPELTEGESVEDWLGVLRRLKATETIFGWALFDAPRGDYELRVSDDALDPSEARLALIQIPLRLEQRSDYLPESRANR